MNNYWRKAVEAEDAQLLLRAGRFNAACNRAYYAMFNAARALLEQAGVDVRNFKTHSGLMHLVSERLVASGILDREIGHALRQAEQTRRLVDYDTRSTSSEEATARLAGMERMLIAARARLEKSDEA